MKTLAMLLVLTIGAPLALVACDRTVESTETRKESTDGSTKVEKKTVTESPSGDVTVNKEKKTVETH